MHFKIKGSIVLINYFLKGNAELRNKDYDNALASYLKARQENPELSKSIAAAIEYVKAKINQRQKQPVKTLQIAAREAAVEFDANFYLKENPDVVKAGLDPEAHYQSNGESEGRKPNPYFDPIFYKKLNSDVRKAGISPFHHFQRFGHKEGRAGISPSNNDSRSTSSANKPILFVGHDGIQAGSEVVLLEVVKWFYFNTNRRIKVLLLAPGPLADKYAAYANTYVLPGHEVDEQDELEYFLDEVFEFTYLNTVVSGRFFNLTKELNIIPSKHVITHIHEMEKVLETFSSEMELLIKKSGSWISASPASTETLVAKYKIDPELITTVPAFINPIAEEDGCSNILRLKARQALGISKDALVVVGCGTVYWRKGPDLFIETAKQLIDQEIAKCEFVWIGDGPDKNKLTQHLTEIEQQHIKFIGNRPDANILVAMADIFFLPSREDPFPLVVLEAAQYGIPSVCFEPATGIVAFVETDAGIALNEVSVASATAAITDLIKNPYKKEKMGQTAKKKLFQNYTAAIQNLKIFNAITKHTNYKPSVSVIVPFYNHAKYTRERINSILSQKIKDIEIIALDDNSTDATVASLDYFKNDPRFKLITNDKNSGSPFKQWEKGVNLASSEIVWIAEGDDSCENNLLETLLPYFDDPLINIASARTEIIDENGTLKRNALQEYFDTAFQDKFNKCYIKDGFQEVNEQLGAACTLVNASGILVRKSSFGESLYAARTYKIAGDWLIYLSCLKHGKIAFSTKTCNYFRRHSASQVHKLEGTETYFLERKKITEFVFENYHVSLRLINKAFAAVDHEWSRFKHKHDASNELDNFYSKKEIVKKTSIIHRKHHVAFYVHGMTFSKGGIERLVAQLANHLVPLGWKVTIFCRFSENRSATYPLYESVNVIQIFDEQNLAASIRKLRHALVSSDIDVFVPMLSEWLFEPVIEAAENTGIPIIASEHNDPWRIEELWWSHQKRIECFNKVDAIHLLLNSYTHSIPASLSKKITVIPNGVKMPQNSTSTREKIILGVGRLSPQKRIDRLIDAAAIIKNSLRRERYRIEIYGDGPLKNSLKNQIQKLGLDDIVFLMGSSSCIEIAYARSSFFVLPSEFEGLPITLLEALSFGLPSIAFRSCNGPNEIIRDGVEGQLVDTVEELADAMQRLLIGPNLEHQSIKAKQRAEDYSLAECLANWESLLSNFLCRPTIQ